MQWIHRAILASIVTAGCAWDAPPVEWEAPSPIAAVTDTAARYTARWAPGATPDVVVGPPFRRADAPT